MNNKTHFFEIENYKFKIKIDNVDEDILRSARRWLSIKEYKHRNFCPFLLKSGGCQSRCGNLFECDKITDFRKNCSRFVFSAYVFSRLVETIVKANTTNETEVSTGVFMTEI